MSNQHDDPRHMDPTKPGGAHSGPNQAAIDRSQRVKEHLAEQHREMERRQQAEHDGKQ